jgi:hypothetical protein
MLTFEQRKIAFSKLGRTIDVLLKAENSDKNVNHSEFQEVLALSKAENQWFSEENIRFALQGWSSALQLENLEEWLKTYDLQDEIPAVNVGIVMAGNIPLVGFHDFLSTLICGHHAIIRQSSNDKRLLPYLVKKLVDIAPEFQSKITFVEQRLTGFDAVIATGSNNTARYFEYYFRKVPHVIRKNRNGIAIFNGDESKQDFEKLGKDILRYFGLGCRNVSKIFVPKNYNFNSFFEGISKFETYIHHHKYANNYEYNKAVYLMSNIKFLDNGFMILKEGQDFSSPIAVVNYEIYEDDKQLENLLNKQKNNIQCTIGKHKLCNFDFGKAQHPKLTDYADGVDTIKFLKNLDLKKHYENTQF